MLIQELIDPNRIPVTCEVFIQNFLNIQNISESILKPPETLKPSETFYSSIISSNFLRHLSFVKCSS